MVVRPAPLAAARAAPLLVAARVSLSLLVAAQVSLSLLAVPALAEQVHPSLQAVRAALAQAAVRLARPPGAALAQAAVRLARLAAAQVPLSVSAPADRCQARGTSPRAPRDRP